MLVFFSITIALAIVLIIFISFLFVFLNIFQQAKYAHIADQQNSGSAEAKRFWQPCILLLKNESDFDNHIEYILNYCNIYIQQLIKYQLDKNRIIDMDENKTIILNIPKELADLFLFMRELAELRNQYISKPFGFRKAVRCAKKLAKVKAEFWRNVIELYPDMIDLPDLIVDINKKIHVNYIKKQIMIEKSS